eukprot:3254513-Amphidinium_carterae.1
MADSEEALAAPLATLNLVNEKFAAGVRSTVEPSAPISEVDLPQQTRSSSGSESEVSGGAPSELDKSEAEAAEPVDLCVSECRQVPPARGDWVRLECDVYRHTRYRTLHLRRKLSLLLYEVLSVPLT